MHLTNHKSAVDECITKHRIKQKLRRLMEETEVTVRTNVGDTRNLNVLKGKQISKNVNIKFHKIIVGPIQTYATTSQKAVNSTTGV